MNRTFALILILLALGLIAYNVTLVDFENPIQGDSTIALIGIVASLCAIVLMLIFMTSKKIDKKLKK
ncbi:hypothetical protein LDL77_09770 [Flagellimonas marinaquae]|uniref:Uncharacterized protein n=2 Tax=Flagellimonas TaxID=444459 RepID=A0ABS7ENE9_9FLAO|nr:MULTISPECIES: hypothetical protein [Allomuricauda]MAO15580.1 hypothetical protein [Allomuricauda sp.]MBO0352972.1 hypothetical protein [Allomuricauda aurea]MBW8199109.1 hypothetical protein [Allomuricauda abyssi]UBZ15986.1 hypothetical protein LDL77_09770 [Allomuricauda aquimarina]|tara:strand:+ start:4386 stop:4586 length:201 start_codon:yes stop_codon:yes gene_type:complete